MRCVFAALALVTISASPARTELKTTYIEYGRNSDPPSTTDFNVRQLWRAGGRYLRLQRAADRGGNSILEMTNGHDLYISHTRPPLVERVKTGDPKGEAHAFILARGGPKALMPLEFGNEVEFFNQLGAQRGPNERLSGHRCAVYTLKAEAYLLTLYVDLILSSPRRLAVKSRRENFEIRYHRYESGRPFDESWYTPPPPVAENANARSYSGKPGNTGGSRPHRSDTASNPPQVISSRWDDSAFNAALKRLRPGDSIQFKHHDGKVAFTWKAPKEFPAGWAEIDRRDYEAALPPLRGAAEMGDAVAQYSMSQLARHGVVSPEEAAGWLHKSSRQGFALATASLGIAYEKGEGVALDKKKAYKLYLEAARRGSADAEFSLGLLFLDDQEFKNEKRGLDWMEKAAAHGHGMAETTLKVTIPYEKNRIQTLRRQAAAHIKLLENAASQGDARAETALGSIYLGKTGAPRDLTKAVDWLTKAAAHQQPEAMILLGMIHLDGKPSAKDREAGIESIQAAIDRGFGPAAALLSSLYHLGNRVGKDPAASRANFKLATELCSPDELIGSGNMLIQGAYAPRDEATGLRLIEFSANKGYIPAQSYLGDHLSRISKAKGLEWHLKAAKQGYVPSQLRAAEFYRGAREVRMDWVRAKHWLEQAAEQGSEEAVNSLKTLKADSKRDAAHFRKILPAALAGDRKSQSLIVEACREKFDVLMSGAEQSSAPPLSSKEFSAGPDSARRNPLLAECLRRVKTAEAQSAALEG